jgi:hypothetical protein
MIDRYGTRVAPGAAFWQNPLATNAGMNPCSEGDEMTAAKPFGNIEQANIMIIGHDPRLQNSQAEAEYAFFLDYLLRPRPGRASEARKYDLAHALLSYISEVADQEIPLESLYVTNLCNEFLPSTHGRGTVLIPEDHAEKGMSFICQAISQCHLRLILPLSLQVSFHLGRLCFFDETDERILNFVRQARPASIKANQGAYVSVGTAPYLEMCGRRLHHHGIPVVPMLHVKQWPLGARMKRYTDPMLNAAQEIRSVLAESNGPN